MNLYYIRNFPGYQIDVGTKKVYSTIHPRFRGKLYLIQSHVVKGQQKYYRLVNASGVRKSISDEQIIRNYLREKVIADKYTEASASVSTVKPNNSIDQSIGQTVSSDYFTYTAEDQTMFKLAKDSVYVYDSANENLYSIKSGSPVLLVPQVSKSGVKSWYINDRGSIRQVKRTVDDLSKIVNSDEKVPFDFNTSLVVEVSINGEVKYFKATNLNVVEKRSIPLIKQGFSVTVYSKMGTLQLIPEKITMV